MPWPKGRLRGKQSPAHLAATRRKPRAQTPASSEVSGWVVWVQRAHRRWRRKFPLGRGPWNLSGETILSIAALPAAVGSPADTDAQKVFNAIIALLFRRVLPDGERKQSIASYVRALPQAREGLLKIVELVEAAPILEDLRSATFHFETVVQTALLVPSGNVGQYVQFVHDDATHREKTIRGVFNPHVFKHYEGRLRGLLSPLADAEWVEQLATIRTVS